MTRYGANAPYDLAVTSGLMAAQNIKMLWDPSKGSQDAIARVASGAYDIGVADLSTLIEFAVLNPKETPRVVFITMARSPKLIMTKKSAGIRQPSDLIGKTLASGATDGASRMYPLFLKVNHLTDDQIKRQVVDMSLRDTLLPRGMVDGIICLDFTTIFNLKRVGLQPADLSMMYFWDYGLNPYGVSVIASQRIIAEHPDAVTGIVHAVAEAWAQSVAHPEPSIAAIKAIDPLVDSGLELERLKWVNATSVVTEETRKGGIGAYDPARLQETINEVVNGLGLARSPTIAEVYDDRFLPPLAVRAVN